MQTLLLIEASLNGAEGASTRLAAEFADRWLAAHPGGRIVRRDLSAGDIPHLTAERFAAFLAKPAERTPGQQAIVDYSDALIAELREADAVALAVPMYNFSVPSTLRAYFDHVARSGVTFRYTKEGAVGLLGGKPAYVFIARGGFYPEAIDTQTTYVRQFLGFVGITDVTFVHAEGLAIDAATRESSLAAAHERAAALVSMVAVAA